MNKENILMVHNYYQIPGGEDTVVENEKRMLEEKGHKVILYTRNNAELQLGIFAKLLLPFVAVFNPRTFFEIRKIIRKEQIDIVHVHNTLSLISPAVFYAACSMGVPVVNTLHNFRLECASADFYRDGKICEDCLKKGAVCALKHKCYRNSFLQTLVNISITGIHRCLGIYRKVYFICLSEFNRERLLELNKKYKNCIDPQKVFVKPNFTFESKINTERKIPKEDGYYLYIGRMEKIKGVYEIIKAFETNGKSIIMIGDGTEYEKLKKYIEKKKLQNIRLLGYVDHSHIGEYLANAKALIAASQWYETFGMVVIEAYACHIPVIVGNIGNIGDLVVDEVTGRKFIYDSVKDLNRVIEEFEGTTMSGEEGYRIYCKKFNEESNYKQLMDIYKSILVSKK